MSAASVQDLAGRRVLLAHREHGRIVGELRVDAFGEFVRFPGGSVDLRRAIGGGWRYAVIA